MKRGADMLRKIRMVVSTVVLCMLHLKGLTVKGFQDLRLDVDLQAQNGGHIFLGKRTTAFHRVTFSAAGGIIRIGDACFFNRNCILVSMDQITVGNDCIFGPNVVMYDHDHGFNQQGFVSDEYKKSPILIEDHCWIGANVTILRGTHIGEGCVIGAGCVVKGDIPAHSIVKSGRALMIEPLHAKG